MGFLKRLGELLGGRASSSGSSGSGVSDPHGVYFYFRCAQCGEVVRIRADRRNDFNRDDDGPGALVLRKEVMGNKCYQLMHATLWVDNGYSVVSADVVGGKLASADEYDAYKNPPAPGTGEGEE